jgi:glycine/D-amino acid oxidase-like deaminating enzyme
MRVDYIIVGQGLCGTFLSWNLLKAGKSVVVIDAPQPFTATKVASGIINPVTGRRIVRTWMIEDLLPFAIDAYTQLGQQINTTLVEESSILDFHPTPQMQQAFAERLPQEPTFLHLPDKEEDASWRHFFRYNYGIGKIQPALILHLQAMLANWRLYLQQHQLLLEETFNHGELVFNTAAEEVQYKDVSAAKIICCDGVAGFNLPWFNKLPYVRTKGEAIIADIPGLPRTQLYKQGITIVPWKDGLFWIGSNYVWDYEDALPTTVFRKKVEEQLNYWLRIPYTITDHLAAERPANIERRPFVGLHPHQPLLGILNGMGTKGCSLAPFFAHELTRHLLHQLPINPLADVQRFKRVLADR